MVNDTLAGLKTSWPVTGVVIIFATSFVFLYFFRIKIGFNKRDLRLKRLAVLGVVLVILLIGIPVVIIGFIIPRFFPPDLSIENIIAENPTPCILALIVWTGGVIAIVIRLFDKYALKAEPLITEEAKTRELGIKNIPIPYIKFSRKFKRGNVLLASAINETLVNKTNFLSLYIKLNGLAPCDFLHRPEDFNKSRYKVGILISTDHYWTRSPNYNGDPARSNMHSCIIDFLRRGNYLITAHDCHPWGEVGFFGPPNTVLLEVRPVRRHPITRGINIVRLNNEEGSHRNNSIGPRPSNGIKKQKVLFNAKMTYVEVTTPGEEANLENEFPAAWLLKYRSKKYNVFYWYPAHNDGVLVNEDFNTVIYNAAKYFLKRI